MKAISDHLARRLSRASAVLAVTFGLCAVVTLTSRTGENPDSVMWSILFGVVACYFAAMSAVARARRTSVRIRDSLFGIMAPSMGYAAAVPASMAVPLVVIETTTAVLGPVAPLVAILSGMAAVLVLMLLARALELRIDPPSDEGGSDVTPPIRILEDLP